MGLADLNARPLNGVTLNGPPPVAPPLIFGRGEAVCVLGELSVLRVCGGTRFKLPAETNTAYVPAELATFTIPAGKRSCS